MILKQVVQVKARKDYKVYVYFSDGKIKLYNMKATIDKGGVFNKIANISEFIKCTVMNGTLAWDLSGKFDESNCLDIDPETIYKEGLDVSDPLQEFIAS